MIRKTAPRSLLSRLVRPLPATIPRSAYPRAAPVSAPPYDLFLSYPPSQKAPAQRLAETLRQLGLNVAEPPAAQDQAVIPAELGQAKALLAWCSEDYFHSRACQIHLVTACLVQGRTTEAAGRRALLLNAEPGLKHIYPVWLREGRYAAAPGQPDAPGAAKLAERLRGHCAGLSGSLGEQIALAAPPWRTAYGQPPKPPEHYQRRERELWDIHALLHPVEPLPAEPEHGPVVVVAGLAGQGKTWLAREYALRFGAAYPGGVFWLSATEAKPTASMAELAENPALKMQLLAFLAAVPGDATPPNADAPTLAERLGAALIQAGKPFLWIVDDLPDGLNRPAFRQWLAPAGALGRTLATTRGQRYEDEAESIHLPPLELETAWRILTRDCPPRSGPERAHTAYLTEELGRHPLGATAGNAVARGDRRHRNAPYAELRKRLRDPYREAVIIAAHLDSGLPLDQEAALAAALLGAIKLSGEAGRDVLRLAANLGDAPLPLSFVAECLLGSGLYAPRVPRNPLLAQLHAVWQRYQPSEADLVRQRIREGLATLRRLGMVEDAEGWLSFHPLLMRAMRLADHDLPRIAATRRAAVDVLLGAAEGCDGRPLMEFAPHARALVADARELPVGSPEPPPELARRARLAALLGDLDLAHGIAQRALALYRQAAAGLARAVAADAEAWDALSDLARTRERIGDILNANGDLASALDTYLKSVRIRRRLAGEQPERADWQRELWDGYLKAGMALAASGELDKARNSYRAALTVRAGLAEPVPEDARRELDLAVGFERVATLYERAGNLEAALDALAPAIEIREKLSAQQPGRVALSPAQSYAWCAAWRAKRADTAGALERYRQAVAEYQRLVALEPGVVEWQQGLEWTQRPLARLLDAQDDAAGAAQHYRAWLGVLEKLIAQGTVDAHRRREVAEGYARLAQAVERLNDAPRALCHYRKALKLAGRWVEETPEDAAWREGLMWVEQRMAGLESGASPGPATGPAPQQQA